MKNSILHTFVLGSLLLCATTQAQTDQNGNPYPPLDRCATMPALEHFKAQHPSIEHNMEVGEAQVQKYIAEHPHLAKGGILNIPVVVHVLYDPSEPQENISDSIIHSQIDVLNEDFQHYNVNAVNTRPAFDSIAVSVDVRFCLATSDPQGNWTTGITRTSTTTDFAFTPFTNSVKRSADGGKDPWPAGEYLNIWVCDMSFFGNPAVLGYAQFPMSSQESIDANAVVENDGVVIQYQYFGRTNSAATAPSNQGRTTTHEVGHWLGLRHIWGDGDCTEDDYVDDTPGADAQSNFDCDLNKNSCDDTGSPFWGAIDPGDMVENFMDYSADDCMNMFSRGQSERIWGFLMTDSLRSQLAFSAGCSAPTGMAGVVMTSGDVRVYPNPSNGLFRMEWPMGQTENATVKVHNELGQEIFAQKSTGAQAQMEINLQGTPSGLYFVSLFTSQGTYVKKLLVD